MDRKRGPDASENASGTPTQYREKTPHNIRNTPETGQQLIDCLTKAQGVLLKHENEISESARDSMTTILNEAMVLARALWKTAKQSENPIKKRLTNIKSVLSKIAGFQPANNNES